MTTKKIFTISIILILINGCAFLKNKNTLSNKKPTPEFIELLESKFVKGPENGLQHFAKYDFSNVDFKDYEKVNKDNIFSTYKNVFYLGEHDELVFERITKDRSGKPEYYKFLQYHKGYPVRKNNFEFQYENNFLSKGRGKLSLGLDVDTSNKISEEKALKVAYENVPAEIYMWQELANHPKSTKETIDEFRYPKGKLLIFNQKLCYQFVIDVFKPFDVRVVLVDAINGDVVENYSDAKGSGLDCQYCDGINQDTLSDCTFIPLNCSCSDIDGYDDSYNLNVPILYSDFCGVITPDICTNTNSIRLSGDVQGNEKIDLRKIPGANASFKLCKDTISNHYIVDEEEKAVLTAYHSAEASYNFYKDVVGIDSYDDSDTPIKINYFSISLNQAVWTKSTQLIRVYGGVTGQCNPFVSMDIISHEYTHAVLDMYHNIDDTEGINIEQEIATRSLHEGISDMMSVLVRAYYDGETEWAIGGDNCNSTSGILPRYFNDPSTSVSPQAEYYKDPLWGWDEVSSTPYYNHAGVLTYWFYLMSEGGVGVKNDAVVGIGIEDAGWVLIDALDSMRVDDNNAFFFEDFRDFTIKSAIGRFGECSDAHTSTARAWKAVGLMGCDDLDVITIGIDETPGDDCTTLLTAEIQGGSGCYEYTWYEENGGGFTPISNQAPFYNQLEAECGMTYKLKISDVIFPECGDVEQIYSTTSILSLNVLKGILLEITPNPIIDGNAIVSIKTDNYFNDASIVVFDITGKVIDELLSNSTISNNHRLELDVMNLPSGVYFIHLSTPEGILTRKFIKQ